MAIDKRIEELYLKDKREREAAHSHEAVKKLDENTKIRLEKLFELLPKIDDTEIWNCHYVAYLLQHGNKTADYKLAYDYAKKAVDMGSSVTKWLYAATLDRWLISQGKKQKFGTQYKLVNGRKIFFPEDHSVSLEKKREYGVV